MNTFRIARLAALVTAGIVVSAAPATAAASQARVQLSGEGIVAKVGAPSANYETLNIGEEYCYQSANGTLASNDRPTDEIIFTSASERRCSMRVISGAVKKVTISAGGELVEYDTRTVELLDGCRYRLSTLRTKVTFPAFELSVTLNGVAKRVKPASPKTCAASVSAYTNTDLTDLEIAAPQYEAEIV